jgi:threonine dehydratase
VIAPDGEDGLPVTVDDVLAAAARLDGDVVRTPSSVSETLSDITGATVIVKFENLQFTASYKERGARNRLLALTGDERRRGVIAMSAGNHAQGLAHHATLLGIASTVVIPEGTPTTKIARTRAAGARVVMHGDDLAEAGAYARALAESDGMVFVSPFDDADIIAGQGTVAVELLADHPDIDTLVVPVGGGGLISGMALVAKSNQPPVEVIGVQSERYPSMVAVYRGVAMESGGPTIAEGIAVSEPGVLTSQLVRALVDDMVVVPERRIEEAICLYLEIEKTVVEGAGAAGLAALLEDPDRFRGRTVGLVLTGGNIDLRFLASVIMRGLVRTGRIVRVTVEVHDRPGALAKVTALLAENGANILDVVHERDAPFSARDAELRLSMETRDADHARRILGELERHGFKVVVSSIAP